MKWNHYYPIYKQHFGKPNRILEIGTWEGDGLFWLRETYPDATLYGIDVDIKPCKFTDATMIEADATNLSEEHKETIKNVDVIIDDGGHRPYQQAKTLETLFPLLVEGGTYAIEDLHLNQRLHWRAYSIFFGIEPMLKRWIRKQSEWAGKEKPGLRNPFSIMFFPQLIIIKKRTIFIHPQ